MTLPFIHTAGRNVSFRLPTFARKDPAFTSMRLALTETDDFEEIVLRKK